MEFISQLPKIDKETFGQISTHVNEHYGINLTEAKLNLVENRLSKRLKLLNMTSFRQYIDHIFGKSGKEELSLLCDFLSTNKTYFYRESAHFDFLQSLIDKAQPNQSFTIWSAACSAGDEVYTISSIFEENNRKKPVRYNVLGTDISTQMIDEAVAGKYAKNRIETLPAHLLKNHFEKIRDEKQNDWYTANANTRKHTTFQVFNLIKDMGKQPAHFDIIFCRNVLIYFKEATKLQVVNDLIKKLKPGGYLILGHCEGMLCRNTELVQIMPAVFQKPAV